MDLIVTHINGDFDSLASLVAAKKLYPQASVILPHSPEKQVRGFLALYQDLFELKDERHFDFGRVKRLIVVDTRLKSRIGRAAAVLNNKKIKVHIYDHHPITSKDIKADKEVSRKIGATVTILIKELIKRKIRITPFEATVMGLGIYEDTGSLTFRTTSAEDVDALSYLFKQGLRLNIVARHLNRELTEEELSILIKLIQKTRTYLINGIHIAISSMAYEKYIADLAILTHRLIDIENFRVIFVLVKIGSKIQMIARSSLPSVDVNKIAAFFGGGGHSSASSSIIRGKNLTEAASKIIELLKKNIKPEVFAKDIMSSPVKTVNESETINNTKRLMTKYNIGGMPVLEKGKVAGIITSGDLDKAIYHDFGHSRIKGYMSKDVICAKENTSISDIQKIIFEKNIGRVPILKNNKITGIVTRNNILRFLHKNFSTKILTKRAGGEKFQLHARDLSGIMKNKLPVNTYGLLKKIGDMADSRGFKAYVVGGFVRDLILKRENLDIDLVVEGEAIEFAKVLSKKIGGTLIIHKRFGTAIIILPGGFRIDVASSRTEFYEYPAALPTVEFSSIKNDLGRRDFAINAMAAGLNKDNFGMLIDFYGGQKDIKAKKIRVLHNLSFMEDPTRIFRAVRFEQRFDFAIDKKTEHLIKTAVHMDMFEKIAGERMRNEIIPILSENNPLKGVKRMKQLHELRFIHKNIKLTKKTTGYFKKIKNNITWFKKTVKLPLKNWLVYFLALADNLTFQEAFSVAGRFVFSRRDRDTVCLYAKNNKKVLNALSGKKRIKPSHIYRLLAACPDEFIVMLLTKSAAGRLTGRVKRYLTNYRKIKIKINGEDLKKMGLKPSAEFKKIMDELLYKKLDEGFKCKGDEINFLRRRLSNESEA
ncbi:MAG: CBS domain-containing protein [Candidatus Omnitrophica bacterium]|nr:CBS domain-containing protein [Candidatus Omnitrophota bacterium]